MASCDRYDYPGYQCYPLKVEIEHTYGLEFTCMVFDVTHTLDGPKIEGSPTCENCNKTSSSEQVSGNIKKLTYWFSVNTKNSDPCKDTDPVEAKVVFRVVPPRRGFHGQSSASELPFTEYDSSNPSCVLRIKATRHNVIERDKIMFESAINDHPYLTNETSAHLCVPRRDYYDLTVTLKGDDISISRQRVY